MIPFSSAFSCPEKACCGAPCFAFLCPPVANAGSTVCTEAYASRSALEEGLT